MLGRPVNDLHANFPPPALGIADGMSIARIWACRGALPGTPISLRRGHFEYRHASTRAMDMPSAMPRAGREGGEYGRGRGGCLLDVPAHDLHAYAELLGDDDFT